MGTDTIDFSTIPTDVLARNRGFVIERLRSDFNAREARVQRRLEKKFPGALGFPIRKAAELVMAAMNKSNLPDYIADATGRFLDRVEAGEVSTLTKGEALGRLLEMFDESHPQYDEIARDLDRAQSSLAKLFEGLLTADGNSYEEIVRDGFPVKDDVLGLALDALKYATDILQRVADDHDLLQVRGAVRWPLIKLIGAFADDFDEMIISDIDEIYEEAA